MIFRICGESAVEIAMAACVSASAIPELSSFCYQSCQPSQTLMMMWVDHPYWHEAHPLSFYILV